MKALTVKNPWAHAIIHLGKDVENRTWATNHRGPLLIHAGASHDALGAFKLAEMGFDPDALVMPGGAIIGVVDLIDCVQNAGSRWAERGPGVYHWVLSNPRPLRAPVPARGRLGLWEIDLTDATLRSMGRR